VTIRTEHRYRAQDIGSYVVAKLSIYYMKTPVILI